MVAGYLGEPLVRFIDSHAPSWCRHISLYLKQRQIVDYTIPPGVWLVSVLFIGTLGFYWLYLGARAKRFGK